MNRRKIALCAFLVGVPIFGAIARILYKHDHLPTAALAAATAIAAAVVVWVESRRSPR